MNNKVLVNVNIPYLEKNYDMFIPVNRRIYSVIKMIKKSLIELSEGSFIDGDYALYNGETGIVYDINMLVRDTDIRNDSKVILL